jgi:Zn-dependent peptidase ImmA (M78 family)
MNTHTKAKQELIDMTVEQRADFIAANYMGPANRFRRQELMKEITGETVPLVKCGITHLKEAIQAADRDSMDKALAAAKPAKAAKKAAKKPEPTASIELIPGILVIRKQCGRKGVIKANANGKMEIELEDGSIRKPGAHRFKSLYNLQNA